MFKYVCNCTYLFQLSSGVTISVDDRERLLVSTLPSVLMEREVSEVKRGRPAVAVNILQVQCGLYNMCWLLYNMCWLLYNMSWLLYNMCWYCILYNMCWLLYNMCWLLYSMYMLLYNMCWLLYNICWLLYNICWLLYNICWLLYNNMCWLL